MPITVPTIFLDGSSLTLDDCSRSRTRDRCCPGAGGRRARRRVARGRRSPGAGDTPVYGINTGFGALAETAIPRDALGALQLNLLRSHAAGVGEPLPVRAVRASMALRANVLAKGYSGIRRATLERLLDLLNRRVHPRRAEPRLGRRQRRSRAARAPRARADRRRRGDGRRRSPRCGRGAKRSRRPARADRARARRKASRSSTARSRRRPSPRWRWRAPIGWRARPTSPPRCRSMRCADRSSRSTHASTTRGRTRDSVTLRRRTSARCSPTAPINRSHEHCGRVQDAYSLRCAAQVHGAARDALDFVARCC